MFGNQTPGASRKTVLFTAALAAIGLFLFWWVAVQRDPTGPPDPVNDPAPDPAFQPAGNTATGRANTGPLGAPVDPNSFTSPLEPGATFFEIREAVSAAYRESRENGRGFVIALTKNGAHPSAYQFLGELEASDPESAVAFANALENDEAARVFYSGFINGLAASDPEAAMKIHLANRVQYPTAGTIDSIVGHAAQAGNARQALRAIRTQLPRDQHPKYFGQVYSMWSMVDRNEALSNLEQREPSAERAEGARALFDRLTHADPDFVDAWIREHPDHPFHSIAATVRENPSPRDGVIEMPVFSE